MIALPPVGTLPERVLTVRDTEWDLGELKMIAEAGSNLVKLLAPQLANRIQRRTQLQTVKNLFEQYRHNTTQQTELSSLVPRLEKTHQILIDERRQFVDEILNRIARRVGELYKEIHPGE